MRDTNRITTVEKKCLIRKAQSDAGPLALYLRGSATLTTNVLRAKVDAEQRFPPLRLNLS